MFYPSRRALRKSRRTGLIAAMMSVSLVASACTGSSHPAATNASYPPMRQMPPLAVDDSHLLPVVNVPKVTAKSAAADAAALLDTINGPTINSRQTGHLSATEQATLASGVDIYNGGTPALLVRRGATAEIPMEVPAAAVFAADRAAAQGNRFPLGDIEDMFTAQITGKDPTPATRNETRVTFLTAVTLGNQPADLVRHALLIGDSDNEYGTLVDALTNGTDYQLSGLQLLLLMAVLKTLALIRWDDLAHPQASASNAVPADYVKTGGAPAAGCNVDAVPDQMWTAIASWQQTVFGRAIRAILKGGNPIGSGGPLLEAMDTGLGALGMAGLVSDLLTLLISTLTFQATIVQDHPITRTRSTDTDSDSNEVTAQFADGMDIDSPIPIGALNCISRLMSVMGLDGAIPDKQSDIAGALASLKNVDDPSPAFFPASAAKMRTDDHGYIQAPMTGRRQKHDKSGLPPYTRMTEVKATVYPATANGRSIGSAIALAAFSDAMSALAGTIDKVSLIDGAIKAIGNAMEAGGFYNGTKKVPMTDYGQLRLLLDGTATDVGTAIYRQYCGDNGTVCDKFSVNSNLHMKIHAEVPLNPQKRIDHAGLYLVHGTAPVTYVQATGSQVISRQRIGAKNRCPKPNTWTFAGTHNGKITVTGLVRTAEDGTVIRAELRYVISGLSDTGHSSVVSQDCTTQYGDQSYTFRGGAITFLRNIGLNHKGEQNAQIWPLGSDFATPDDSVPPGEWKPGGGDNGPSDSQMFYDASASWKFTSRGTPPAATLGELLTYHEQAVIAGYPGD